MHAIIHTCNLTAYWGPQFSKQPIHIEAFFFYIMTNALADIEV